MKITAFDPVIASKQNEELIALFEELGFERRHNSVGEAAEANTSFRTVRLKHPDGFHLDVSHTDRVERDEMSIRINVDNFDEAFALLEKYGFVQLGDRINTGSSIANTMEAPSGMRISLCHHIKKNEQGRNGT